MKDVHYLAAHHDEMSCKYLLENADLELLMSEWKWEKTDVSVAATYSPPIIESGCKICGYELTENEVECLFCDDPLFKQICISVESQHISKLLYPLFNVYTTNERYQKFAGTKNKK